MTSQAEKPAGFEPSTACAACHASVSARQKRQTPKLVRAWGFVLYGGRPGIRTLGTLLTFDGFQDRCIQPLCQPSSFFCSLCKRAAINQLATPCYDSGRHDTEMKHTVKLCRLAVTQALL